MKLPRNMQKRFITLASLAYRKKRLPTKNYNGIEVKLTSLMWKRIKSIHENNVIKTNILNLPLTWIFSIARQYHCNHHYFPLIHHLHR